MCGRMACARSPECLSKACAYKKKDVKSSEEPKWVQDSSYTYKPSYNISPSSTVCVLADKVHFNTENLTQFALAPMRWGIIPIWNVKDDKSQFHTHNARIEKLMESKIYKNEFIQGRRCVVVCDGFYEWQTAQKSSSHQPYFIYNEYIFTETEKKDENLEKPLLLMAGIFNKIKDTSTTVRYTCSILTKDSDERLSWCHHRMPVILDDFSAVEKWIEFSDEDPKEILAFIKEYQPYKTSNVVLRYHAVDKMYVNNSSCDDKKCIERMSVKRKSNNDTLDKWLKKK